MKKKTKKMIAPIVITILIVLYLVFYFWMGLALLHEISILYKILLLIIPTGLIVLSVSLLHERIQEIRGGETDDLSKY